MNNRLPPRWLVVGLMMFPQIVETIYSPVLTHIATEFRVSEGQASQTLSVYFLTFAAGVVCWGRLCDLIGRRPAMLAGLLTYGAGTLLASGSSWLVWASQASLWFLLPMTGVVIAFGLAIPNVLSQALLAYREVAGSAGALFGLGYYLLLSLGLAVAASLQDLGLLLGGCGLLALCCCWRRST